jgi:hypothetical protein
VGAEGQDTGYAAALAGGEPAPAGSAELVARVALDGPPAGLDAEAAGALVLNFGLELLCLIYLLTG